MFDVPYLKGGVGPETVSAMTRVCSDVKGVVGHTPLGVQILAGGWVYITIFIDTIFTSTTPCLIMIMNVCTCFGGLVYVVFIT